MTSETGLELEDPLEEDKDSSVPGLTHRYPDRVLMVTTHVCSMYCRFCTRKRVTLDRDGWDPLSLPISKLRWFVNDLAAIEHLDVIRIGTRVPVTLSWFTVNWNLIGSALASGERHPAGRSRHPAAKV